MMKHLRHSSRPIPLSSQPKPAEDLEEIFVHTNLLGKTVVERCVFSLASPTGYKCYPLYIVRTPPEA